MLTASKWIRKVALPNDRLTDHFMPCQTLAIVGNNSPVGERQLIDNLHKASYRHRRRAGIIPNCQRNGHRTAATLRRLAAQIQRLAETIPALARAQGEFSANNPFVTSRYTGTSDLGFSRTCWCVVLKSLVMLNYLKDIGQLWLYDWNDLILMCKDH
jgi:hypothetical protein